MPAMSAASDGSGRHQMRRAARNLIPWPPVTTLGPRMLIGKPSADWRSRRSWRRRTLVLPRIDGACADGARLILSGMLNCQSAVLGR